MRYGRGGHVADDVFRDELSAVCTADGDLHFDADIGVTEGRESDGEVFVRVVEACIFGPV